MYGCCENKVAEMAWLAGTHRVLNDSLNVHVLKRWTPKSRTLFTLFIISCANWAWGCHKNKMATSLNLLHAEYPYLRVSTHFSLYKVLCMYLWILRIAKVTGPPACTKDFFLLLSFFFFSPSSSFSSSFPSSSSFSPLSFSSSSSSSLSSSCSSSCSCSCSFSSSSFSCLSSSLPSTCSFLLSSFCTCSSSYFYNFSSSSCEKFAQQQLHRDTRK